MESTFENKNGKIKSELEMRKFGLAEDLFSILKRIYFVRNRTGPHDVPPPESIRARITITECLPAYIDYLDALSFLGLEFGEGYNNFLTFFSSLTDTNISLIFQDEVTKITSTQIIRDFLYRDGFFEQERTLRDVQIELRNGRYNFSDSSISKCLGRFSKGKNAFLTKKGKRGSYRYIERIPPSQYFQKTI